MNQYQDLVDSPIFDGKTIKELLMYDGISYWWFLDTELYSQLQRQSHAASSRNIFKNAGSKLLQNGVPLLLIYDVISFFFWGCINKIYGPKDINSQPDIRIIYQFQLIEWRQIISETSTNFKNVYHGGIIKNLSSNVTIVAPYGQLIYGISDIKKFIRILKVTKKQPIVHSTFPSHWSWSTWHKHTAGMKYFHDVWKVIEKNDSWFSILAQISGLTILEVTNIMRNQFFLSIPVSLRYSLLIDNIVNKYKPSVVVMINEQMSSGRNWVYTARKHNIPTIGIQHGVIANHHAYFNHNSDDVSQTEKEIGTSFPIPDITCVWGETECDLLVNKAGYPQDQVIVTGNPRYDNLGCASKLYSRNRFCERYNIKSNNKIILWATQCHGMSMAENHANFKEVFDACVKLQNTVLIIKQHPGEGQIYTDLIHEYLEKYNLKIPVIVPDKMADTTEMVYVSDVLINKFSTTGHEAVAFYKPMIIMDFSEKPDIAEYVREGVGIPVFQNDTLLITLEKIFHNSFDLTEAQDAYIKNHMYKLDAHASDRIANLILDHCI